MAANVKATIDDLYRITDKAEIVNGELVWIGPAGAAPGYAAGEVFISLRQYARSTNAGLAVGDNRALVVDLPHRNSFSPCAAFYTGPPAGMRFFEGAPVFAVEVRNEEDYGPAVERARAGKRADYFAAGTLVVWDVDLLSDDVVRVYRAGD